MRARSGWLLRTRLKTKGYAASPTKATRMYGSLVSSVPSRLMRFLVFPSLYNSRDGKIMCNVIPLASKQTG